MKKKPIYHTATAKCLACGEIIKSERGGHFLYCSCGKSFIDQERWGALYVRLGGDAEFIEQICPAGCKLEEHKNNKKHGEQK